MLACNRTHSGGDIFEALNLLFGNSNLIALLPESSDASPLNISVYNWDREYETFGPEDEYRCIQDRHQIKLSQKYTMPSPKTARDDIDIDPFRISLSSGMKIFFN